MNLIPMKYRSVVSMVAIAAAFCVTGIMILAVTTTLLSHHFNTWTVEIGSKSILTAYSFLVILALSKGRLPLYGFRWPRKIKWLPLVVWGLGLGFSFGAVGTILKIDQGLFLAERTFLQLVIIGWVCASLSEEILVRGLVQGYLDPLQIYGVAIFGLRISLPVFVAAFLFGLMHLVIFLSGASVLFVMYVVILAFTSGLISGYYRDKTTSLVPAIVVHFLVNMSGCIAGSIF